MLLYEAKILPEHEKFLFYKFAPFPLPFHHLTISSHSELSSSYDFVSRKREVPNVSEQRIQSEWSIRIQKSEIEIIRELTRIEYFSIFHSNSPLTTFEPYAGAREWACNQIVYELISICWSNRIEPYSMAEWFTTRRVAEFLYIAVDNAAMAARASVWGLWLTSALVSPPPAQLTISRSSLAALSLPCVIRWIVGFSMIL